jgi:hypothetical protein
MLQSEPGNFLIVGPEDVISFRGHAQTIPPARHFFLDEFLFAAEKEEKTK